MPKGPINLITNNFKIKSQNNHSGIIYTYTVDFIDGENLPVMPLPEASPELKPEDGDDPSQASGDGKPDEGEDSQNPEQAAAEEENKQP